MELYSKTYLSGTFWRLVWAASRCFVLTSFVWCLVQNGGVQSIILTRGEGNPQDEHKEVLEGEVLSMNCSVSHPGDQPRVRWVKLAWPESAVGLADNNGVKTSDSRVSLVIYTDNNYDIFSIRIANVTISDSGVYACSATWTLNNALRYGEVQVFVKNYPREVPTCSTNTSDVSPANQIVWCDSIQGYPEVTITWTVESEREELNGTLERYTDETEQERVRNVLHLSQLKQPYPNLVCTVTSEAFPGLNATCNISLPVGIEPSPSLPPVTRLLTSVQTATSTPSKTDARGAPGANASTLVPAVVLPVLLILLPVVLILVCIVKQKRQDQGYDGDGHYDQPGRNPASDPEGNGRNGNVIIPYSVTTLQAHAIGDTERTNLSAGGSNDLDGENVREAPYETWPGLAKGSAGHAETPELNKTKDGQNPKGHYYSTPPDAAENVDPMDYRVPDGERLSQHVNTEHDDEVMDVEINAPKLGTQAKYELPPKHEASYEVNLKPGCGSVSYAGTLQLNAGDSKGQLPKDDVPYYTTPADDHDTNGRLCHTTAHVDPAIYEHVNPREKENTVVQAATSNKPKKSRTAKTIKRFVAKLKPTKQSCSPADKPEDGLMDNPIYHSLDGASPMVDRGTALTAGEEVNLQPIENNGYLEIV